MGCAVLQCSQVRCADTRVRLSDTAQVPSPLLTSPVRRAAANQRYLYYENLNIITITITITPTIYILIIPQYSIQGFLLDTTIQNIWKFQRSVTSKNC